jgi:ATP-binding cassette subfamily F protein 3
LEAKLADVGIYEQNRKAELTQVLNEQTQAKAALSTVEEQWFAAQEELEQMTTEFWQKNGG